MDHYNEDFETDHSAWTSFLDDSAFEEPTSTFGARPSFAKTSSASSSTSTPEACFGYSPLLNEDPSLFLSTSSDSPISSIGSEPATPPASMMGAPLIYPFNLVEDSKNGQSFARSSSLSSSHDAEKKIPLFIDTTVAAIPSLATSRRSPSPTINYVSLDAEARQLATRVFSQTNYSGGKNAIVSSSRIALSRADYLDKKRKMVSFSTSPGSDAVVQVASAPMPSIKNSKNGLVGDGRGNAEMNKWLNALRDAEVRAMHSSRAYSPSRKPY